MKNITLIKPVVLRSALNDMTVSQREIAVDLLSNRKFLLPGADGLRLIENTKNSSKLPKFYLYGSEAVCYYRQSLDLPDVSLTDIEIDDIVMNTEDFDTLYDILYLLNRVRMRNSRFTRLLALDAPAIILWNEYRMLQEHMEDLQDNNWCGHPVINRFNTACEDEAPEWHEEIRKSLTDINYSLLRYKVSAKYSCGFPDPQVLPIIVVDRYLDYFTTIMEDRLWQVLAKPGFRWRNRSGLSMNAAKAA